MAKNQIHEFLHPEILQQNLDASLLSRHEARLLANGATRYIERKTVLIHAGYGFVLKKDGNPDGQGEWQQFLRLIRESIKKFATPIIAAVLKSDQPALSDTSPEKSEVVQFLDLGDGTRPYVFYAWQLPFLQYANYAMLLAMQMASSKAPPSELIERLRAFIAGVQWATSLRVGDDAAPSAGFAILEGRIGGKKAPKFKKGKLREARYRAVTTKLAEDAKRVKRDRRKKEFIFREVANEETKVKQAINPKARPTTWKAIESSYLKARSEHLKQSKKTGKRKKAGKKSPKP